jgi:glutamate synthase (NADPH/NADH) large chain
VRLRTDGGIRTGRDVVIAALLGAQEFGIGTASLIAMGCLMVRQCQSNTCPVGVCVQDQKLRDKFTGTPDKVINLFTFIAKEVREILAILGFTRLEDIVGRTDLLAQVSRGASHLDDLDLNPLLVRVEPNLDAPKTSADEINPVADTLDAYIIKDAHYLLTRAEKLHLTYTVRNTMRAVGTRTSHALLVAHPNGLPEDHLRLDLNGSAGQSLGAFAIKGLLISVDGEANDYVGKGLSGATIVIRSKTGQSGQALAGNTLLYGATSGQLYIAGSVGERFAVRNSGAIAVIEGAGAHACEYMTGGEVVILGPVGSNFGAGMSGGRAFVYDPNARLASMVNHDTITLLAISQDASERLKRYVETHLFRTRSLIAKEILDNWDITLKAFVEVVPNEILAIEMKSQKQSA